MTLPQVTELFDYWRDHPPENELVAVLAQCFTSWKPRAGQAKTPEEHMRSLEARWQSGAMNVKQLFEGAGGGPQPAVDIRLPG